MVRNSFLESFGVLDENLKLIRGQKIQKCRKNHIFQKRFLAPRWRKIKILIVQGVYLGSAFGTSIPDHSIDDSI